MPTDLASRPPELRLDARPGGPRASHVREASVRIVTADLEIELEPGRSVVETPAGRIVISAAERADEVEFLIDVTSPGTARDERP